MPEVREKTESNKSCIKCSNSKLSHPTVPEVREKTEGYEGCVKYSNFKIISPYCARSKRENREQ